MHVNLLYFEYSTDWRSCCSCVILVRSDGNTQAYIIQNTLSLSTLKEPVQFIPEEEKTKPYRQQLCDKLLTDRKQKKFH